MLDLIILNDYAHVNGGAARVALDSAVALAKQGHRVRLLAAVGPIAEELKEVGVRVTLTNQYDIKSDPFPVRAATQGIWNVRAARCITEILRECDPLTTVVHVHGWSKALSSSAIHAAVTANFSVVVTLHDYFYACPNGAFFNFQRREMCKLRPLSGACLQENCDRDGYSQKLWRSIRQGIQNHFGFSPQGPQNFIVLSELAEQILGPFLPPDATLYRIPNPIDAVQELPVDVASNYEFMSVGRLSVEKGLELFAEAAKQLGCVATFVGEGPSRAEITRINPQSQITGWLPPDQVVRHLRSARAMVFPSLWYEARPLAILEAAAIGVPAIVPDQNAARELILPNETGLLFRNGDVSDLREKLAVMQDSKVAGRLGRAAYSRYWQNPFTMSKHIVALERCYDSILEQRAPKSLSNLDLVQLSPTR